MSTVSIAEHAIILGDYGYGLMNSAYNLIEFEPPKFGDPDLDKFLVKLGKEFPKEADKIKITDKGVDGFRQRSTELLNAFKNLYFTLYDVQQWNTKVCDFFAQIQPQLHNLDFESNPEFFRMFFTVFITWVKINILLSRACNSNPDTVRQYVQAYARAHLLETGNTETKFPIVQEYVSHWYNTKTTVYDKLRVILDPHKDKSIANISLYIGIALDSASKFLTTFQDYHYLQQRLYLSVIDNSDDMLRPTNENVLQQLVYLPDVREWIVWGYLVCPAELTQQSAVTLLVTALSDYIMLPLHRDQYINIHELIDDLFSDYTIKSLKFKLSRQKNLVRDITETYQSIVNRHIAYRRYLAAELESLQKFLRISVSGVTIGPKISLIFALLRLSVAEIDWYYIHRLSISQTRPFKANSKFTMELDPFVSCLVHNALIIRDILLKHPARFVDGPKPLSVSAINDFIPQSSKVASSLLIYYSHTLACDTDNLRLFVQESQGFPPDIQKYLNLVLAGLETSQDNVDVNGMITTSLQNVRLNLRRLCVLALSKQLHPASLPSNLITLLKKITPLFQHTVVVDNLDNYLFRYIVPLRNMIWYLPQIQHDVKGSLAGLSDAQIKPTLREQYCVALIRTLGDSTYNIHRVCPEELSNISQRSSVAIDTLLNITTKAVCDGLSHLSKFYLSLRRSTTSLYAITLLQHESDTSAYRQLLPGHESALFDNTNPSDVQINPKDKNREAPPPSGILYTQHARLLEQATFALCATLCRVVSIRINQYDISPREYMTTALQAHFRFLVRSQVVPKLADGTGVNTHVDEILNTADPDATIQFNYDNFHQISLRQQQLGPNQEGPMHNIRRPSLLLLAILNVIYLFHNLDRECNFGFVEICRLILVTEFTCIYPRCGGEDVGSVDFDEKSSQQIADKAQNAQNTEIDPIEQAALDAAQNAIKLKTPILTYICDWYMDLFSRDLEPMNINHNAMLNMYEGRPIGFDKRSNNNKYAPFWPHLYTDPNELRVLVSLCGPHGIEYISKYLIVIVQKFTHKIFEILGKNVSVLKGIRGRYTEPQGWINSVANLVERDELLRYTVVVGNALQFRTMLLQTLNDNVQKQIPLVADVLSQSVQTANTFVIDNMYDSRVLALKTFATTSGTLVPQICDDPQLKEALRRLKTNLQDLQIWSLLPEMYGLALYSDPPFVQRAKYLTATEGFTNNLHLVVHTVRDLIGLFTTVPIEAGSIVPYASDKIRAELTRFMRIFAFCVISLSSCQEKTSSPELMILIEKYVSCCHPYLNLSQLEHLIPYSALRTHYIHYLETQTVDKVTEE